MLTDAFHKQQWESFLANELPTRKNERYKYADFSCLKDKEFSLAKRCDDELIQDAIHQHRLQHGESILMVFVNGYFMPMLSDLAKLTPNVIACRLQDALNDPHHADLVKQYVAENIDTGKYPFANLNTAIATDGLFFYLPNHCEVDLPLHLLSIAIDETEFCTYPKHVFVLGENSKLTIVEEFFSHKQQAYIMNEVKHITLAKDAKLNYCKIQNEGRLAIHLAHIFLQQMQNSFVTVTNFSFGAQFARDDLVVLLKEPGAKCKTAGFYRLRQYDQYIDHHIDISHAATHSTSEMLYKGVLAEKSRAVFNGRLLVEKDAQKTLAYQANHNLLLSNQAEIYSKPELEIYADDVKCKHGATTGQLDQDALFYLRARGINKDDAINILLQGFAEEILQRIDHPGIKLRVLEMMS